MSEAERDRQRGTERESEREREREKEGECEIDKLNGRRRDRVNEKERERHTQFLSLSHFCLCLFLPPSPPPLPRPSPGWLAFESLLESFKGLSLGFKQSKVSNLICWLSLDSSGKRAMAATNALLNSINQVSSDLSATLATSARFVCLCL